MFTKNKIALYICFIFFLVYSLLGVMRQNHFLSGYDLAVIDQAIWKYSTFQEPISTNHAYAFTSILTDHLEFIFILIAPVYWIFNDIRALILLQALAITSSGYAVYLLCRKKELNIWLTYALLVSFLMFYGIQNAIWADVHSLVFGASFLAWFLYFLEEKKYKYAWIFFFLAIACKEDMALLTFFVAGIYVLFHRNKHLLGMIAISILYLIFVFFIYFPNFVPGGYRFQNRHGLLADIKIENLYNTSEKRDVLLYSSAWFGFLPFLSPIYVIPALADIDHYFILGNAVVTSGQSLFMHYRVVLALLLVWPTIMTLSRFKKLNNKYVAIYILLCAFFLQYHLHLPLSYLAKQWFWKESESHQTIHILLQSIPKNEAIVTQVNILPHASHRKLEFLMWPTTRNFIENSPCGAPTCQWFRWPGEPSYMLVDISPEWDARYWLTNRKEFIEGLSNLEKMGIISLKEQRGTTLLYIVHKRPEAS